MTRHNIRVDLDPGAAGSRSGVTDRYPHLERCVCRGGGGE